MITNIANRTANFTNLVNGVTDQCLTVTPPPLITSTKAAVPSTAAAQAGRTACYSSSPSLTAAVTKRWLNPLQLQKSLAAFDTIMGWKTSKFASSFVSLFIDSAPDELGDSRIEAVRDAMLEAIQDPGNVGALIRTAAAFDYSLVILSDGCADPFAPKSVQASSGTVLSVAIRRTPAYLNVLRLLKERGYRVAVADVRGEDEPGRLHEPERLVFALGNEAAGPTAELLALADHHVRIPIHQQRAESLNVAACGAIGMYLGSRVIGLHARSLSE